ncbi:DUF4253 domain-containing protein [Mucilaginibacter pedocola]|uniref:DUF4253 domain-containing protein n=1 Tax=Mucilaginibacter pedocola TaxID=1792845 RepID=A0A1S9PLC7_9SPHI|nr:DUF4253 domain-containing protein [Mucilaginibacter pedocola]OOQ61747.1 hypothetical protein BC343_01365 [Mucilaginibacter pedocola]
MKANYYKWLFWAYIPCLLSACESNVKNAAHGLTTAERKLFDSLQIDTGIVKDIKKLNHSKIEDFHYSLGRLYDDGKETEVDPIHLKGLVFDEQGPKSYKLVFDLKDSFRRQGYSIFLLETNFNIGKKPDRIAVLKTTDKYAILKQIGTDGINYNITNDCLITIIHKFDKRYSLELIAASGDWCEFVIHNEPKDWLAFAKDVYAVCPDVVDQGAESVEAMAGEMQKTKRLYLWWD